jgi:hypothetical protein
VNAKINTRTEVPGLGVSIEDVRLLAAEALSVLGVNLRADNGRPTVETIYRHGLTELSVEMDALYEVLDQANDPTAMYIGRFRDRIELLNECAGILAKLNASNARDGAP